MKKYIITLSLYIEAENKEKAISEFYLKANECVFSKDDLTIEEQ